MDAAFAQKLPTLPQGTSYDVIQMSPNVIMPFVSYALISKSVSPADLRAAGAVSDRAAAYGHSGDPAGRRVWAGRRRRCKSRSIRKSCAPTGSRSRTSRNALSQTNSIEAVGRLEDNDLLYLAINNNAFTSIESVRNVALHTGPDGIVRLSAILREVTMGTVPQWLLVDDNGKPAVTFDVYQQDSADSLSLAREVQRGSMAS